MMKPKYRMINLSDNKVLTGSPESLAAYLLGRNVSNYLIIKTDERGSRLVPMNPDCNALVKIMHSCP
jgi:hypothetical protein